MSLKQIIPILVLALFLLPALACGGSTSATPTHTPVPTWTPTAAAEPATEAAPTEAAITPWSKIVDAYVGPDGNPDNAVVRQSFTAIMTAANEVVMDKASYTPDETARAQAIFDAAADAHDALMVGDGAKLAARWKSLDTFVALLKNVAP